MMTFFRRATAVLLILAILAPSESWAARRKKKSRTAYPTAVSAALLDSTAMHWLYAKNIDKRVYPASTTKVMTAMLALEKLDPNGYVTVSSRAIQVVETKLNMKAGEQYRVKDLVYACLLKSANDAANVLAEAISGSQADFVDLMNQKAKSIGAVHTKFANAHGLPSDNAQYTTARDMAIILRQAIRNPFIAQALTYKYRIVYSKDGRRSFLKSHNKSLFLNWKGDIYGKTGYTNQAQACFVGYYTQGGRTYIVAVFGCRKRWEDIRFIVRRWGKYNV